MRSPRSALAAGTTTSGKATSPATAALVGTIRAVRITLIARTTTALRRQRDAVQAARPPRINRARSASTATAAASCTSIVEIRNIGGRHEQTTRYSQRGSAMLVTMIIITSLLAGAAVLVSMQLASNRSSDLTRTGMSSRRTAPRPGLSVARPVVASQLHSGTPGRVRVRGTVSGAPSRRGSRPASARTTSMATASPTSRVYIKDNDDELPPAPNDLTHDSDLRVFIVSRCIKYADTAKEVEELVEYSGGGRLYQAQQASAAAAATAISELTARCAALSELRRPSPSAWTAEQLPW